MIFPKNTIGFRCLLLLLLAITNADAQNFMASTIPSLNQLPVNAIHRIFQDSEGYMWYGTVNGLCRDDGYQVKVFRSDIYTPKLLRNNLVECIAEDKEGKIWFGTDKGAYVLDKKDYSVKPLDPARLMDAFIQRIDVSSDKYVWVSVQGHLLKYRKDGVLVKNYSIKNGEKEAFVAGFCEARDGRLIVTFSAGLVYYLNREKDKFIPFPSGLKNNNPSIIIQDREHDYFWLSTWGDGLVRFNPYASPDSMYVYQPLPVDSKNKTTGIILHLKQDEKYGYLWGTSSHDLVAYKQNNKGMLEQIPLVGLLPGSNRMLNDLILDRRGNLWVSAFDQPSFVVHFADNAPRGYTLPTLRENENANPAIMSLVDAGDNVMWISQERTGICLYGLKSNKMSCYRDFSSLRGLSLGRVKEMAESQMYGAVWIVPEGGSVVYRLGKTGFDMHLENEVQLKFTSSTETIKKILENAKGDRLWIGTSAGLYSYNLKTKKIESENKTMGFVTSMIEGADGTLWVSTNDKGLYKKQLDGGWVHYGKPWGFSSMSLSPNGLLWFGTEEGAILSLNPETEKWEDYSVLCGTKGDQVNQVMVDDFNHLWVDMNQRIIEFNPRNGSYRTYQTTDDNMLLWRLIPTAICRGKDGNIYFGGIPGIFSVTPSNSLERETRPIKTIITDVTVMNNSLIFDSKGKKQNTGSITLNASDRNIRIYFSTLDHLFAHKIRYAYRLKGVDKDWIYTANGVNFAFYNRLSKGNYSFEVRATDQNGLWSNEVTTFSLRRLPAIYETWWAYVFYALLLLGVLLYALFWYTRQIGKKHDELWSDSEEMMKMRRYLDSPVNLPEPEYMQLDEMLLSNAVAEVEKHLTESDFDVSKLATAMNMSRSTLTRKLKIITGRTPLDFIRNIKMQHARRLLEDKNKTVSEVALTLGYFNRKYFTSCFKDEFGITPSEYQKSLP